MTAERLAAHMAMVVELREKKEHRKLPLMEDERQTLDAAIASLETALLASAAEIEKYVDDIPDLKVRLIFRLHYVHGVSWSGVAREMHYSKSGVRSIVERYLRTPAHTCAHPQHLDNTRDSVI